MLWPEHINKVICGDAIETMKGIPDGVIQCCVTSPPYWGLRDYGLEPIVWGGDNGCKHHWGSKLPPKAGAGNHPDRPSGFQQKSQAGQVGALAQMRSSEASSGQYCDFCPAWRGNLGLEPTPELYVEHLVEVFREVRRVLKDDGTLWLNLGDSYAGSGKAQGQKPEHTNLGKPQSERPYDITNWISVPSGLKPKDLVMIPARVALALQADGWWLRSVIIWNKPSCMPESVTDRPTTAHEYVYLLAKSADYYCDMEAIKEPSIDPESIDGRRPRNPRQADQSGDKKLVQNIWKIKDPIPYRNKRTVWTINPEPTPYAHFATFPQKLVEPCIMAGTSEKGNCDKCGKPWVRVVDYESRYEKREPCHQPGNTPTKVDSTGWKPPKRNSKGWQASCACGAAPVPPIVIDIFLGSGTTAVVAKRLGRKYIGVELNEEYCKIARDRLSQIEMELKI